MTGSSIPISDALGSTLTLTDDVGAIHSEYAYEPYGRTAVTGMSNANSFQYVGRENDGTGLYYYRARYYHPSLQRFIREDPLDFLGGDLNLYAYVGGNPTNYIDPIGMERKKDKVGKTLMKILSIIDKFKKVILVRITSGNSLTSFFGALGKVETYTLGSAATKVGGVLINAPMEALNPSAADVRDVSKGLIGISRLRQDKTLNAQEDQRLEELERQEKEMFAPQPTPTPTPLR